MKQSDVIFFWIFFFQRFTYALNNMSISILFPCYWMQFYVFLLGLNSYITSLKSSNSGFHWYILSLFLYTNCTTFHLEKNQRYTIVIFQQAYSSCLLEPVFFVLYHVCFLSICSKPYFFSLMCLWSMCFLSVELYTLKRNCVETTSIAREKLCVSSRLQG